MESTQKPKISHIPIKNSSIYQQNNLTNSNEYFCYAINSPGQICSIFQVNFGYIIFNF